MSDLIDKRDERTKKRKKVKRKMDSIIGLSRSDEKHAYKLTTSAVELSAGKARLLDEGYIDNGFVIKKGTLEKFLKGQNQYVRGWEFDGEHYQQTEVLNITDDFVGTVNLGHIDFAILPFELGRWTREDLTLVEIENDRHALDVNLHLDEESAIIKELRRQPFDIGISAEFWVHENMEDTEALSEMLGYYMPVFDEVYIFAYGLVGECGNVNSSGLELNAKEMDMPNEEMILDIDETKAEEAEVELDAQTEVEIPPTEEPQAEESEAEEAETEDESNAEESEEEEAEANGESEAEEAEVEEAEAETAEGDEDESDEDDGLAETLTALQNQIEQLTNTIKELTEANASLKKSNRKLSNKLQAEKEKKEKFIENAKGLSVQLLPEETEEKKKETRKELATDYYNGDGIGEL